jgi:broad specificity phosphatase PhoE
MNLILVRHGETDWNRTGRCQGISDVVLNDNGKKQALELGVCLKGEKISAVYSSDLARAMSTAEEIAKHHGLTVETDSDLREMDQGEFEGLLFTEIRERFADIMTQWRDSPETLRIPSGESLSEVRERALRAFGRLCERHDGETVVAVSHNLTITTLLCEFTGIGLSGFRSFGIQAASRSTVCLSEGKVVVVDLNDISHLTPVDALPHF